MLANTHGSTNSHRKDNLVLSPLRSRFRPLQESPSPCWRGRGSGSQWCGQQDSMSAPAALSSDIPALTGFVQTLLDASRKQTLSEVVDINLSKDEDSVNSLAVTSHATESSFIALAGINSSEADQEAGKNEHLRLFQLDFPQTRKELVDSELGEESEPKRETRALGRLSLFTPSSAVKKETYQRVLRLSRPRMEEHIRFGAIASGLAPEGEIVTFDTTGAQFGRINVRGRLKLGKGIEAVDVDVLHVKDEEYWIAYCTDYDVYLSRSSPGSNQLSTPQFVHGTPHPDTFAKSKARPKFRSIRFLTPDLILLLQAQPDRTGAELLLLEVPKFSPLGFIILRKRLHRGIKSANALAVSLLPGAKPGPPSQKSQHVIAIAGQDTSITIVTLDHASSPPFSSPIFCLHAFLPKVHPLQITSLAFSTFMLPPNPSQAPPQYLKLASTSIASTVVVHTLPLTPLSSTTKNKSSQRYVLRRPGRTETAELTISVLVAAVAIALGAFFLQAFIEIRGGTPEYLGAKGWLSERVSGYIVRPYMFEETASAIILASSSSISSAIPSATTSVKSGTETVKAEFEALTSAIITAETTSTPETTARLRDLLSSRQTSPTNLPDPHADDPPITHNKQAIIIHASEEDHSLAINLHPHDDVSDVPKGKQWDEMEEDERERWRRRLIHAGEWAVEEGEAVLKGVFFSGVAGAVGDFVGGILAGG